MKKRSSKSLQHESQASGLKTATSISLFSMQKQVKLTINGWNATAPRRNSRRTTPVSKGLSCVCVCVFVGKKVRACMPCIHRCGAEAFPCGGRGARVEAPEAMLSAAKPFRAKPCCDEKTPFSSEVSSPPAIYSTIVSPYYDNLSVAPCGVIPCKVKGRIFSCTS